MKDAKADIDFDAIRSKYPLDDYVERNREPIVHNKIHCPFHKDNSRSLHIYEGMRWYCYGACRRGGDILDFISLLEFKQEAKGETLFKVLDLLGEVGVRPLSDEEREKRYREREEQSDDQQESVKATRERFFLYSLDSQRKLREVHKEIFRSWGISDEWAERARLGFDGKRLTIPAFFRGVTFSIKKRRLPSLDAFASKDDAKYIFQPGSVWGLYNADILLSSPGYVVVCEDEKSALAICSQGGVAIATTGGAGFWGSQKAGLWDRWLASIPLLYFWRDTDEAGLKCALDFQARFRRAEIVDSSPYKDASDCIAAGIEWQEVIF